MNRLAKGALVSLLLLIAAWAAAQQAKQVSIWVSKDVAPSSKIRLQVNTRNVPRVHVAVYRVNGEKWLSTMGVPHRKRPSVISGPLREWDMTVAQPGQKPNPNQSDTYYSRQVNLPKMSPGVYLLSLTGGAKEAWAVVNVTHFAVVSKRSPKHLLVWVTDAVGGRVVPGARVSLYTRGGDKVKDLETGKDGALFVPMQPGDETVVVAKGSDMAGVETGAPNPDGRLVAHFQTDRPIYRPGQAVSYKAILRRTLGQGYRVDSDVLCTVQLRDPKDNPIDETKVRSNAMGSIAGKFDLPSEGMVGPYTLVVFEGKDRAYQTISVQEYRKPEFKVDVNPVQKRYLAGEEVVFQVDAQYYFGAPVQQAAVHYRIQRSPSVYTPYDPYQQWFYGGDGNLYPRDIYGSGDFIADETAYTDENGKVLIKVPSKREKADYSYSISLTVEDSSRRQVEGSGSVPVYAAKIRMALQAEIMYATLGEVVPFTLRVIDLDGKPTSAQATVKMLKQEWDEKTGAYKERLVETTRVKVPAIGKVTFSLPAKEDGSYTIVAEATDDTGRQATANTGLSVWGNYKPRKKVVQPTVGVQMDKRVYMPGQTAKAFLSTNTPDLPMLVTVEGGDIWDYQVIERPKAGQVFAVKTNEEMSPNAYVDVAQWVKGQLVSGNQMVPLPNPAKQLTVTATPDKPVYRPGERATYTIKTVDAKGSPRSAEVALSVVDEAIYALSPDATPDLYTFYWGLRGNNVQMFMSAPEEMSGGAFQRVSTTAPLRQRFEDTAFWNAFVTTGKDGTGQISFMMPDNLTTWRATARAITQDTSVGTGKSTALANRPVMLRLATPRQIVNGDKVTLIGTIDNRSDSPHQFDISLDVEGIQVEGDAKHRITVPAKKQVKVQWKLNATSLPKEGKAVLVGQAVALDVPEEERADMSDAVQVSVPVVPNGVRQHVLAGGLVGHDTTATITLPQDQIAAASKVHIEVSGGIGAAMRGMADQVLRGGRWSSTAAANQLVAASALKLPSTSDDVREAMAMLAKNQHPDGWGWWEHAPTDPVITARVLWSLGLARRSGITVYENMIRQGMAGANAQYDQTNLWEHRALLAASLMMAGDGKARARIDEVIRRGENVSPYAKLRMAEAMYLAQSPDGAADLISSSIKDVSEGPNSAFLPTRQGIGWTADSVETTAEALAAVFAAGSHEGLQPKLARWLALPDGTYWRTGDDSATTAWVLSRYAMAHPDPNRVGDVEVLVNGKSVRSTPAKFGDVALIDVPAEVLKNGANKLELRRTEGGEAFFSVDASIYVPRFDESVEGVRVLRRFEVQNDAGTWEELNRKVRPGEPVRVTIVSWGDDIPDAMRIVEPLPAGFEFIDGESDYETQQEVRDGAVIHYLVNQGNPQIFRYYIRAEAEGNLSALPVTAEYMRRPADRGQSQGLRLDVQVRQ